MRLRSRILSVVFVAAVVGCSYDWTVGDGLASDAGPVPVVDAGTIVDAGKPKDAGVDAATTPTSGECGTACACKSGQRCAFTCTKSPCTLTCADTSNCTMDCAAGVSCNIACSDKSTCDMACKLGANCGFKCEDQATCTGTCTAAICTKDCKQKCDVTCNGGICL